MSTQYRVKGLMADVFLDNGFQARILQGGALPDNASPEHVEHLLRQGLIEEGAPVGGLGPVFVGDGLIPPAAPAGEEPDDVDGDGPIPAKSAAKDAWVAYAVSKGAAQADAEAATKDDLIAAHGQPS